MDDARQMTNWVDGFAKIAAQRGITAPDEIQELMKLSWCLGTAESDPHAFNRAYDQRMEQRTVKQAGAASTLANMLRRGIRKLKWPAALAVGGAAAIGGADALHAGANTIADNVELTKTRDLNKLLAEQASRPLGSAGGRTPYSGIRV